MSSFGVWKKPGREPGTWIMKTSCQATKMVVVGGTGFGMLDREGVGGLYKQELQAGSLAFPSLL